MGNCTSEDNLFQFHLLIAHTSGYISNTYLCFTRKSNRISGKTLRRYIKNCVGECKDLFQMRAVNANGEEVVNIYGCIYFADEAGMSIMPRMYRR